MTAQIVIVSGPDRGRSFPLSVGETLQIGRSQTTATRLIDQTVSRVHCQIDFDGDQAVLMNISAHGTFVNGKQVSQHTLRHGDLVRLGGTEFRFQLQAIEEAETVLQPPKATRSATPANLNTLVGQELAHYRIESVIARGQTGVVFRAVDQRDNQPVALKVMQPEFSRNDDERQRFIRAMKTVIGLRHPNLVSLLAAGKSGAYCWMAMEFVEGESMKQVIHRIGVAGMLDWRYGYRVAVHVARALEYAHGEGVLHRNLTPSNILLRTADKTALLGDLMLVKALEGTLAQQLTRPGELLGEIAYLAPERTQPGDVDGRADLYGLGATVYALIAGRPPFTASTLPELIAKIRTAEPEKPRKYQMAVPELFQGTVMKLLARSPEQRFASAGELLCELERVGKFSGLTA